MAIEFPAAPSPKSAQQIWRVAVALPSEKTIVVLNIERPHEVERSAWLVRHVLTAAFAAPGAVGSLLGSLEDPRVSLVGDLGQERQVVAAETGRILPVVAVLVEPGEG